MNLLALVAQAGGASAPQQSPLSLIIMFGVIGVIFYVFLILPQRKRQKAHEAMIQSLKPGDRVTTAGGLVGIITKAEENEFKIRIAPSVEVGIRRGYVIGKDGEEQQ